MMTMGAVIGDISFSLSITDDRIRHYISMDRNLISSAPALSSVIL